MQLCDLFPTLSIKRRIGRYARLETLVTRPDASNRLSHVTLVFRITLRSSVSKHLRFGISTPCRNISFASAIPISHLINCLMSQSYGSVFRRFAVLQLAFPLLNSLRSRTVLHLKGSSDAKFTLQVV